MKKKTTTRKSSRRISKIEEDLERYAWLSKYELDILRKGGYFDEEGVLHNGDGCIRCTSIVKSTGKRCRNFAIPGELQCRIHGGTSGRAAAGFERIYSAFIEDPGIEAVYNSCQNNVEVRGIQDELALLRALLAKSIQCINNKGDYSPDVIKEVAQVVKEIRNLVKGCVDTQLRLGYLMDIGRMKVIAQQMISIIERYIPDEDTLRSLANEFDNIIWPGTVSRSSPVVEGELVYEVPKLPEEVCDRGVGSGADS